MAVKQPPKQFKSWSFSRLQDFRNCPFKAKLKHLDKIPEPKSEAMQRGIDIHDFASDYIKGKIKALPPELKLFRTEFDVLKKAYKLKIQGAIVEENWAFTKDWSITQWDDWVGCVVRIKLDAAHFIEDGDILEVWDWKSGKFNIAKNEEYMEQLDLYALAALLMLPDIIGVRPVLGYLDTGDTFPSVKNRVTYYREDLVKLKRYWDKQAKPILIASTFPPRPNKYCYSCHFRKGNEANGGGQCKYGTQ